MALPALPKMTWQSWIKAERMCCGCCRLEEALAEVTDPLNAANAEVDSLRMQCEQLDAALLEAEGRLQDASAVSAAMQQRFMQAEQELEGARQQAAGLQAAVAQAQQDVLQAAAWQARVLDLEQQLTRAKTHATATRVELAQAQADVTKSGIEQQQMQTRVDQLNEELSQGQGRFDSVRAELTQAREETARLQQDGQRAQARATDAQQRLQDLERSSQAAQAQSAAAHEDGVQQLQAGLAHAQARIRGLEAEVRAGKQHAQELVAGHADAEQLREAVHSAHEQKQALNRHLQETQRELLALAGLLEQSLQEKRRLERVTSDSGTGAGARADAELAAQVGALHQTRVHDSLLPACITRRRCFHAACQAQESWPALRFACPLGL